MTIELLAIGKTDSKEVAALVEMYARRVNFYCKFSVTTLPDVRNTRKLTPRQQAAAEGEAILRQTAEGDFVALLDERGEEFRSVEFALWLQKRLNSGPKRLVLVIGGPYGFSEALAHDLLAPDRPCDLRRTDLPRLHDPAQRTLPPRMTVMRQAPAIAILSPNVLTAIGLRSILEKVAPAAETELFGSFRDFEAAGPERFFHYFVTARLFVAHAAFFRERRHKTIVLSSGEPHLAARGMHCLDVRTAEERLVSSLLRLQRSARRPEHALTAPPHAAQTLSDREAEVLTLIAEGLLNKQIAQRLGIGLTTVISHRRNIMEKLGIRSVAGLVVYALTEGYAPTDDM